MRRIKARLGASYSKFLTAGSRLTGCLLIFTGETQRELYFCYDQIKIARTLVFLGASIMNIRNLAISLLLAAGWALPGTATADGAVTSISVTPTLVEPNEYVTVKAFGNVPQGKQCRVLFQRGDGTPQSLMGYIGVQPYAETKFSFNTTGIYEVWVWGEKTGVAHLQCPGNTFKQKVQVVEDKDKTYQLGPSKRKYYPMPKPGPPPVETTIEPGRAPVETIKPGRAPVETTIKPGRAPVETIEPEIQRD